MKLMKNAVKIHSNVRYSHEKMEEFARDFGKIVGSVEKDSVAWKSTDWPRRRPTTLTYPLSMQPTFFIWVNQAFLFVLLEPILSIIYLEKIAQQMRAF